MNQNTAIILLPAPDLQPASLFTPTPRAAKRVLEFFTAQINNDHTRKAYLNATRRFAEWCDGRGITQLASVEGATLRAPEGEHDDRAMCYVLAQVARGLAPVGPLYWSH